MSNFRLKTNLSLNYLVYKKNGLVYLFNLNLDCNGNWKVVHFVVDVNTLINVG